MNVRHRFLPQTAGTGARALLAAFGFLASFVAVASAASAATLSAGKACYVNGSSLAKVQLGGGGFHPGDSIQVQGIGFFATGTAGPGGEFLATGTAPGLSTPGPGTKRFVLTATDQTTPGLTATTTIRVANLSVATTPSSVKNLKKDKVTFTFSGFTPGRHIYGYYMRKRIVATVRFGKASGPCGTLRQKALLYPGGHPRKDEYGVTFENTRKYSKKAFPRVTGKLNILHF